MVEVLGGGVERNGLDNSGSPIAVLENQQEEYHIQ